VSNIDGRAVSRKSNRRYRKSFDRAVKRRREIEAHARYVGAADTDDLSRWLIAWVWHNWQSKDQTTAVIECARRIGRKGMSPAEAAGPRCDLCPAPSDRPYHDWQHRHWQAGAEGTATAQSPPPRRTPTTCARRSTTKRITISNQTMGGHEDV
jgi:hypothetical protein